jgi:hypothetical protein
MMLNTDLKGFWEECKHNKILHLLLLVGVCIFLYSLLSKYMNSKSDFENIVYLQDVLNNIEKEGMNTGMSNTKCNKDIPRMDEAIFKDTINLPNRNPAMLTSSMVYPVPSKPSDEDKRKTRMDVLNMFYSSFDDDLTSIKARPQNLYIIP